MSIQLALLALTAAGASVAAAFFFGQRTLHDRMPVILAGADWAKWLGEVPATEEELLALLKLCPEKL